MVLIFFFFSLIKDIFKINILYFKDFVFSLADNCRFEIVTFIHSFIFILQYSGERIGDLHKCR